MPDTPPTLTPAERQALNVLGPVICALSGRAVSMSWAGPVGPVPGYYHVDWRDERGRFWSGAGDTPSEAVDQALHNGRKAGHLIDGNHGFTREAVAA